MRCRLAFFALVSNLVAAQDGLDSSVGTINQDQENAQATEQGDHEAVITADLQLNATLAVAGGADVDGEVKSGSLQSSEKSQGTSENEGTLTTTNTVDDIIGESSPAEGSIETALQQEQVTMVDYEASVEAAVEADTAKDENESASATSCQGQDLERVLEHVPQANELGGRGISDADNSENEEPSSNNQSEGLLSGESIDALAEEVMMGMTADDLLETPYDPDAAAIEDGVLLDVVSEVEGSAAEVGGVSATEVTGDRLVVSSAINETNEEMSGMSATANYEEVLSGMNVAQETTVYPAALLSSGVEAESSAEKDDAENSIAAFAPAIVTEQSTLHDSEAATSSITSGGSTDNEDPLREKLPAEDLSEELPVVERMTNDDTLATAAANVRKSWRLIPPDSIEALINAQVQVEDSATTVAMLAAALAEVVARVNAHDSVPLTFIKGQTIASVAASTTTTSTVAIARAGAGGISALGGAAASPINSLMPASLIPASGGAGPNMSTLFPSANQGAPSTLFKPANTETSGSSSTLFPSNKINGTPSLFPPNKQNGPSTLFPSLNSETLTPLGTPPPTNPFSALWPNGLFGRLGGIQSPLTQPGGGFGSSFMSPALQASQPQTLNRNNPFGNIASVLPRTWGSLLNMMPKRQLIEAAPVNGKDRFGNFLHDDLSKEVKRKIWDDFVTDSRQAKSADEQNALLRRLERKQSPQMTGDTGSRSSTRQRQLIEFNEFNIGNDVNESNISDLFRHRLLAESSQLETIAQKIGFAADLLEKVIAQGTVTTPLIEASRLYLATLEPSSQARLLDSLPRKSHANNDTEYLSFKETHNVSPDLDAGLLLLTRLERILASQTKK